MKEIRVLGYEVQIRLPEVNDGEKQSFLFADQTTARRVMESAHTQFVESLKSRADVDPENTTDEAGGGGSDWKVVYWTKHPKGYVCRKAYFDVEVKDVTYEVYDSQDDIEFEGLETIWGEEG